MAGPALSTLHHAAQSTSPPAARLANNVRHSARRGILPPRVVLLSSRALTAPVVRGRTERGPGPERFAGVSRVTLRREQPLPTLWCGTLTVPSRGCDTSPAYENPTSDEGPVLLCLWSCGRHAALPATLPHRTNSSRQQGARARVSTRGLPSLSWSLSLVFGGTCRGGGEGSPAEPPVAPPPLTPLGFCRPGVAGPQAVSSRHRCGAQRTLGTGRSLLFCDCTPRPCCPSGSFFRVVPAKQQDVGSVTVSFFSCNFKPRQMPLQTLTLKKRMTKHFFPIIKSSWKILVLLLNVKTKKKQVQISSPISAKQDFKK